jgi:hypothetical protein
LSGYLVIPITAKAANITDSAEMNQLLVDVKTEVVQLKNDAADLDAFAKSNLSWQSRAFKIENIKTHVNNSGKLLAKLKDAEANASRWQQTAIQRIEPLMKDLDDNMERTIKYLNANQSKVHFSEYKEYVKANYEVAADLEALIRDFVAYGEAKQKMERLGERLEINH